MRQPARAAPVNRSLPRNLRLPAEVRPTDASKRILLGRLGHIGQRNETPQSGQVKEGAKFGARSLRSPSSPPTDLPVRSCRLR